MRGHWAIPVIVSILILGLFGFSQDAIADPAALLKITTQPTNTVVNSPITVVVEAQDPFGNLDPTFGGAVSVSIGADPSGGTAGLFGTITVFANSGIATFNNLSIDVIANGYTLILSSDGLSATNSNFFDVLEPLPDLSCGDGTIQAGDECVINPEITDALADALDDLAAALIQIADLEDTITDLEDALAAALEDLGNAFIDLANALATITELETEVEELGQPGAPVENQGEGQGVPAQGKNNKP